MVAADEDALICDMAETYRVYNWRELPLATAAALAFGLSEDSRIKKQISGHKFSTDQILMGHIIDRLATLIWFQTADGHNNRNRPKSFVSVMLGNDKEEKPDIKTFGSGAEFDEYWKSLQEGGE